jgi:hypothetical protein
VKQGVLQPVRGQARMQIPVMLIRYVLCTCAPFPHTAVLAPIHHANVILCHSLDLMEQKSVIIFLFHPPRNGVLIDTGLASQLRVGLLSVSHMGL